MQKLKNYQKQYLNFMQDHCEDFAKSSNNYYSFTCPCGRNKKMAFSPLYNQVKCWSAKCLLAHNGHYSDTVLNFTSKLLNKNKPYILKILAGYRTNTSSVFAVTSEKIQKEKVKLPDGFTNILDGNTTLGDRARKYLQDREFDLDMLSQMGFGYTINSDEKEFGYIIVPFKVNELLTYYIGRAFLPNLTRYYNPPVYKFGIGKASLLFNEDALVNNKDIFLVEGWACAVTLGIDAISIQGSILSDQQLGKIAKSPVETVTIIPDYGFYHVGVEIAIALQKVGKIVYLGNLDKVVDEYNLAPENYNDVNSIGKDKVMEMVNELTEFSEDDLFSWSTNDNLPFI